MTFLIIAALAGIVISLGQALFAMGAGPQNNARMVNALTVRVILSVALFILLFVGKYLGWLAPHGV